MSRLIVLIVLFCLFLNGCKDEPINLSPECQIILPVEGKSFEAGELVSVGVVAEDTDGTISEITIFINDVEVTKCSGSECSYSWNTTNSSSGIYEIMAVSSDDKGASATATVSVYIIIPPVADFTIGNHSNGVILYHPIMIGESVQFTDRSLNNPTEWYWDFGDGHTSTQQNPVHQFNTAGVYDITLTASNRDGSDTKVDDDLIGVLEWVLNVPCPDAPTVTDSDGNVYSTVQIGSQCWMAENLKVGVRIDGSLDQADNDVIESYYYDDLEINGEIYGGLYQWDEMMQYMPPRNNELIGTIQGICPDGWHIPTGFEQYVLINYLGGNPEGAGGRLKAIGTEYWKSPNAGATNESGFTAFPGGIRNTDGSFIKLGEEFNMWLSQTFDKQDWEWAENLFLEYDNPYFGELGSNKKKMGLAVRCVKNDD